MRRVPNIVIQIVAAAMMLLGWLLVVQADGPSPAPPPLWQLVFGLVLLMVGGLALAWGGLRNVPP